MSTSLKTLRIFWHENCRYRGLFATTALSWLSGMILQKLILALIAARALEQLIELHASGRHDYWPVLWPYIIGFVILALVGQALIDLGLVLLSKLETKVRPAIQMRLFDALLRHSLKFHANTFSGSLVTQVNRFTGAYVGITDTFILVLLKMLTNVVVAIVVIVFFSPLIALAMLLWTVLFVVLNTWLVKKRIYLSKLAAAADSVLTGHLADSIGNISTVKAFAGESQEFADHEHKAKDRALKKYVAWMRTVKNDIVLGLLMSILQLGVLVLSIIAVMNNAIGIGTLLLIQVYVTQIITELWGLSNVTRTLEQNFSDAAEMTEILDEPIEVTDPVHPQKIHITKGDIAINDISFTHDDSKDDDVLFEHFSLHIAAGEKVGLVGHSGSGKTTLTKLLLRFADVDGGVIRIDGQDISQVRQSDLRSRIAYVPQEPALFHRTLAENIGYGKPGVSPEEIHEAARKAHAAEFIEKLPRGYSTMVGERGVKLSGGQRQRIAIARAILKDAPILILDEATSALDSESEALIQDALWKLMQNRTALVIAHRLSTIQKMDRIIVLNDGAIAEEGTHKQLLAKKGIYAQLWAHQSGGFIEE